MIVVSGFAVGATNRELLHWNESNQFISFIESVFSVCGVRDPVLTHSSCILQNFK